MTVHGYVPTKKQKMNWKDYIKSLEDYKALEKTGMLWLWFPDIGTWKDCEKELKGENNE